MEQDADLFASPIVCHHYDLELALRWENDARIAREDAGKPDEDEDPEIEDPLVPRHTPDTPPVPAREPSVLHGRAKKNQKKRERERTKRKAAARESLASLAAPAPSPRVLEKAAQSVPLKVNFSAKSFRATKQRWTGSSKPMPHPLLAHADDAEFLKAHLQYFDWPGELFSQTHALLDRNGYVIGVLVSPPAPEEEWSSVVEHATNAFRSAREKMSFPAAAFQHRRASGEGFPAVAAGFAFGVGRQEVGNIKASSARNAAAMDELLADPSVGRIATSPVSAMQATCYHIFSDYHEVKQVLLAKNPHLRRTFPRSPFAAVTANLGPVSVSPPHTDGNNKADGLCLISALGSFNPDLGGHLVLWDYNMMVRFPPGCSVLIPSAVVTHSNTPIFAGEERFSLIQYSAGALFRWVANGHQSDLDWYASATAEDLIRREEARKTRCATALKKFSRWKDIKVKNFTGRARVEVWDEGDVADFSDLTDVESEGEEPPTKRCK
ncbi:hypothetical protein MSAN_02531900 [Mycena sanguinolenta]|uniref:Uncharacterized protein n=1 Tax=Mycena sanguinolenta TaxID=230812 RepID=A0A8H6TWC7_9AGAR|nr:hypothetical protein MSAN_02531900 [Mycena sanguinolenta]